MDVPLRSLSSDDRAALVAILQATPEFTDEEVAVALELIDDRLAGGDQYRFVVAEADDDAGADAGAGRAGSVAGYGCFGPAPMTDGVWDLYWIVVDPARRSGGLGTALLGACESEAAASGARMMLIETASKPDYAGTRRFYERAGYVEAGRIADYYRAGDDKVTYRKTLRRS